MTLNEATKELRRICDSSHAMIYATGTSTARGELVSYHACVALVFDATCESIEGLLDMARVTMAARRLGPGDVDLSELHDAKGGA